MSAASAQGGLRIQTSRLVLRPADLGYAQDFSALLDDVGIAEMTSRIPHPYGLKEAEAFLASRAEAAARGNLDLQIEDWSGRLLGGLGVDSDAGPLPEVGYWIGRPFWGKGVATEALNAVLEALPTLLGRRGLAAGHFSDNPASGRVLEKAGFLYTGVVERRFSMARQAAAETRMMIWLA